MTKAACKGGLFLRLQSVRLIRDTVQPASRLFVVEIAVMANELYTRTNQKIYFAGLSLEALGRAEEGKEMNAIALVQAGREAALFHLYGALLGLCHEIAGFYRLPQAGSPRAEMIMNQDVLASMAIPELAELVEMAQSPDSWVARLLKAHADMFQPPQFDWPHHRPRAPPP
jgi:hypothetical protein